MVVIYFKVFVEMEGRGGGDNAGRTSSSEKCLLASINRNLFSSRAIADK